MQQHQKRNFINHFDYLHAFVKNIKSSKKTKIKHLKKEMKNKKKKLFFLDRKIGSFQQVIKTTITTHIHTHKKTHKVAGKKYK